MIYVLLPAYNEEDGIGHVLAKICSMQARGRESFHVVVVDDGSRDATSAIAGGFADRLAIKVFRFEQNRGVSEVFKTGMRFVTAESKDPEHDVCVVLDSDNTQDPELMLDMVGKVRAGEDIVIASRFAEGGGMRGCPWFRGLLSVGVSWIMRTVIGLPGVKDYSTFYRAYRVRTLKEGFDRYGDDLLAGKGFAAISALLIKLGNVTSRICEVPFVLRYDLKQGTSGIKVLKTMRGYFELIGEYWMTKRFQSVK